jgi:hypothetical protein
MSDVDVAHVGGIKLRVKARMPPSFDGSGFTLPLPIGSSTITMAQRHVQWTRLPDGETSAVFTEQVKRLLSPAPLRAPNRARQAEASLSTPRSVARSSEILRAISQPQRTPDRSPEVFLPPLWGRSLAEIDGRMAIQPAQTTRDPVHFIIFHCSRHGRRSGAKMVQHAQLTVKEERLTARRYKSTARKHHKLVRLFDLIRQ